MTLSAGTLPPFGHPLKVRHGVWLDGRASATPQGDRGRFRHRQGELEALTCGEVTDLVVTALPTDFAGDRDLCGVAGGSAVDGQRQPQFEHVMMHPEGLSRGLESMGLARRSNDRTLDEAITDVEEMLTQIPARRFIFVAEPRLGGEFGFLYSTVTGSDTRPTAAAYERLADLESQLSEQLGTVRNVLASGLPALNALAREHGIGVVVAPPL